MTPLQIASTCLATTAAIMLTGIAIGSTILTAAAGVLTGIAIAAFVGTWGLS